MDGLREDGEAVVAVATEAMSPVVADASSSLLDKKMVLLTSDELNEARAVHLFFSPLKNIFFAFFCFLFFFFFLIFQLFRFF